jgi:hypothetical protein
VLARAFGNARMCCKRGQHRERHAPGNAEGGHQIVEALGRCERQGIGTAVAHRFDQPVGARLRRDAPVTGNMIDGGAARAQ